MKRKTLVSVLLVPAFVGLVSCSGESMISTPSYSVYSPPSQGNFQYYHSHGAQIHHSHNMETRPHFHPRNRYDSIVYKATGRGQGETTVHSEDAPTSSVY